MVNTAAADPIVAIATGPGRGGIGIVRVSGASSSRRSSKRSWARARLSCAAPRAVRRVSCGRRRRDRPGYRAVLSGAAFVHRRERARAAGPWRTGRVAHAACALPAGRTRDRTAHCGAGRVHAARVSKRPARPCAGRSGGRSDRRDDRGRQRAPRCVRWPASSRGARTH